MLTLFLTILLIKRVASLLFRNVSFVVHWNATLFSGCQSHCLIQVSPSNLSSSFHWRLISRTPICKNITWTWLFWIFQAFFLWYFGVRYFLMFGFLCRQKWAHYLKSQGIPFLFWSAKAATALLEGKVHGPSSTFPLGHSGARDEESEADNDKETAILGREELLSRLQQEAEAVAETRRAASQASISHHLKAQNSNLLEGQERSDCEMGAASSTGRVIVGFVGYPNVGKSSTINALVGEKKTGVTSTPGKTKHFQTLIISEKLMLCDCPGLVFPSFTGSRSEMVAAGVLPIDRMTDHRGPIDVVATNVPRCTLESFYGITLPQPKPYEPQNRPPTAAELLRAYASSRNYVASSGLPDETRASRQILKDYINGKLAYCYLPPNEGNADPLGSWQVSSSVDEEDDSGLDLEQHDSNDESESIVSEADEGNGISPESVGETRGEESTSAGAQLLGVGTCDLETVFSDLDTLSLGAGAKISKSKAKAVATHKMHRKAPRRKDRSWRVQNDESDGMPLVRAIQKPVSHGAAQISRVAA